jgi:hypothetical protein
MCSGERGRDLRERATLLRALRAGDARLDRTEVDLERFAERGRR